jgi:agmatinase
MRHNSKIRFTDLRDSRARGNDVVSVKHFRERGIDRVLEHVEPTRKVYVSIDIDVLDMPLVPGCGSGEVGGLDYSELAEALFYIASKYEIVGFDLVEVNPMLDVPARNTSYLAAQIMTDFLGRIVEQPRWKAAHSVRDEVPLSTDGR